MSLYRQACSCIVDAERKDVIGPDDAAPLDRRSPTTSPHQSGRLHDSFGWGRPLTDPDLPIVDELSYSGSGTADNRSSNQLLRRFTKSKSIRRTDNPAVLLGVSLTSSQNNSNSLHLSGLKICLQNDRLHSSTVDVFSLQTFIPNLLTVVSAGPPYCY